MLRKLLLVTLIFTAPTAPAEPLTYNRVDFQVEAARDIDNDLLVATLGVEIQNTQPAAVARQLNLTLNDALEKARTFNTVKTSSGQQRTYPVYSKRNQIDTWRGHGELRLESRDFKAAGELIMQLQNTMQLGNLQFTVAADTRATIENDLISTAIKSFQLRADAIRHAMGAKNYKTVQLSISNNGAPPRPMPMLRGMAMAEAAPEFAGGESRMSVQISGTIELEYKER